MEKINVERSIWINAPREKVWQVLSDDKQIGLWWPPNAWEIPSLELGTRIRFGNEPDAAYATISEVEKPQVLALKWDGTEKFPVTTMLTRFTLTEENGGTRLTVVESGFETLPENIRQNRVDGTAKGYSLVLGDLKSYVEGTFERGTN